LNKTPAEGPAAAPAKPADAKPAGGGTVITLDPNAVSSPSERAILERLGERRQELDARARELEIRENLLKSAEKRLDGRVDEIKGMESQLGGAAQQKKQADAARLKGLVTMYENMKAKDAAKIFDRLEMRVLIDVVMLINPRRMSDIMAQMQPEMAEKLTVELANRASGTESAPPPVELPKIEGRAK
jgi:flagellar motility protein MotE (MotC chaperone)